MLQFLRAGALKACPFGLAVCVLAMPRVLRLFNYDVVKVCFPIRPFLSQWDRAETDLDPAQGAVVEHPGLLHAFDVFAECDRTGAQASIGDGVEEGFLL